jgi:two-component system phosphate regulon sensor histidine kinase PhoR
LRCGPIDDFDCMLDLRKKPLLPVAGMAALAALPSLAWIVRPDALPGSWTGRLLAVLAAGALAALAVRLTWVAARGGLDSTRRFLDELCGLEFDALNDMDTINALSGRAGEAAWQALGQRVFERLKQFAERAQQVEMARATAEVRIHRVSAERDHLREIVAGLCDPVIAVDQFGEIVLANPSAERLLDVKTTEEQHPALAQLKRCEQLVGLLTETRRRRSSQPRSAEVTLADEAGQPHFYRVVCRTLASQQPAGGKDGGQAAVAVLTDITSQKAIQKRNAEFVSAVSHEMKAPLSSIRAYVELLVDGEADDEELQEEFLGVINSQADRLQRLIDNLLNLARIEAGVVAVNKNGLSLNELLAETLSVMQPQATSRQISLVSDFSPLYLGVLADRDMLLQAAINLTSNAVKYTRPGGTVTLRSRLDGEQVVFEVQDTGVGLSPEDCQRVFEKFYRVKKDRDMAPGTGLGLALVKHIVEDVHGGRIEVASESGHGSTFRTVLPGLAQLNA